MRAAFLVPGLGLGGAERAVIKLANGLATLGWSVDLVVFGPVSTEIRQELTSQVRVSSTGRLSAANPWLWVRVWLQLRVAAPRVVIGWSTYANFVAALLKIVSRKWYVVVVERNYPPQLFHRSWTSPIRRCIVLRTIRRLYRLADAVGANSDVTLAFLRRYVGVGPVYIKFSNFVAVSELDRHSGEVASHLPEQGGGPRLLAVGRLSRQKGFDVLLHAMAAVRAKFDWRLAIVGDGEERVALRALAVELGLEHAVSWVGSRQNPFPYYAWADVVICSSRYEGSPNVLLEAMALGKATISTDCRTGPRELTAGGQAGLLVPVNDAEALTRAIVRLGTDDALRAKFADRARARVADHYEREAVVRTIAHDLERYVAGDRRI